MIRNKAFAGCSRLASLTVDECVLNFASTGTALFSKNGKVLYWVSPTVSDDFTVPTGVTIISSGALYGNALLKSVSIPSTVNEIRDDAFKGCTSLTDISFDGTKKQWNSIKKTSGWNTDTAQYVVHCTDGDVTK
jgi:hypothetical protein